MTKRLALLALVIVGVQMTCPVAVLAAQKDEDSKKGSQSVDPLEILESLTDNRMDGT